MFRYDEYCIDGEVWKEIPRYEGLYEASSLGRIRSVDGKVTYSTRHGRRVWNGRILHNKTKVPRKEGYKVDLWKNRKPDNWIVARLVCMAFHGAVEFKKHGGDRITVNHKDGDRLNNKPENLEWLTLKENIRHGFENGLYRQCVTILIQKNGCGKKFRSQAQASNFLGRNNGYINLRIRNGKKVATTSAGEKYEIVLF